MPSTILNLDNLIIDRPLSGTMFDRNNGQLFYSLNQIKEPSLECSGETVYTTDAVGANVAAFDRSKNATLSGSNAFINLGLAAAQFGSKKTVAGLTDDGTGTAIQTITVPVREVCTVIEDASSKKIVLEETPSASFEIKAITRLTADGGLAETYTKVAATPAGYQFAQSGKNITLPSSVAAGTQFVVLYKKDSAEAVQFDNSANQFAQGGEFWLEVLFCDICDPANLKYHGYIVFPNAKMSSETTIDFNQEATHGFKIDAMQDYCDPEKKLFYIVVSK